MRKMDSEHCASQRRYKILHHKAEQHISFIWACVVIHFFPPVLQIVSSREYQSWLADRKRALAAIDGREELMMASAVQLETELTLLGKSDTFFPNTTNSATRTHKVNLL